MAKVRISSVKDLTIYKTDDGTYCICDPYGDCVKDGLSYEEAVRVCCMEAKKKQVGHTEK